MPLVDLALDRVGPRVDEVAVNVHHGRAPMDAPPRRVDVHRSFEEEQALGTAGALGHLRRWIDGRGALVVNADAWCPGSLLLFADGWDRERVRLLSPVRTSSTPDSAVAGALMPWSDVGRAARRCRRGSTRPRGGAPRRTGALEVVRHDGPFVDCGTPARLPGGEPAASGGESVVGDGAVVEGTLDRCVVWPGRDGPARGVARPRGIRARRTGPPCLVR